jgi:hypothetical protein
MSSSIFLSRGGHTRVPGVYAMKIHGVDRGTAERWIRDVMGGP